MKKYLSLILGAAVATASVSAFAGMQEGKSKRAVEGSRVVEIYTVNNTDVQVNVECWAGNYGEQSNWQGTITIGAKPNATDDGVRDSKVTITGDAYTCKVTSSKGTFVTKPVPLAQLFGKAYNKGTLTINSDSVELKDDTN
jgi:hypothetical protein